MGDGATATKMGSFKFGPLILPRVAVMAQAKSNLISMGDLDLAGCNTVFADGKCSIYLHGKLLFTGVKQNGVYMLDTSALFGTAMVATVPNTTTLVAKNSLVELHQRFGHISTPKLHEMLVHPDTMGLIIPDFKPNTKVECVACSIGKAQHLPVYKVTQVSTPLFLTKWFVDVHHVPKLKNADGLVPILRFPRYIIQIVDDATRLGIAGYGLRRSTGEIGELY